MISNAVKKQVGIISSSKFMGAVLSGSSKFRTSWPLRYWPEAEEFALGKNYEAMIFQKAYWLEGAKKFKGIKIFDLCDPDFIFMERNLLEILSYCHAVTVSNEKLREALAKLTKLEVVYIPDRLDFEEFGSRRKNHAGRGPAAVAGWFGYGHKLHMLDEMAVLLPRFGIKELLVVSNEPYRLPPSVLGKIKLINIPWNDKTVYDDLINCDLILNPSSQDEAWQYKSNNKTITAWALGLPVARNAEELKVLVNEKQRIKEADEQYDYVRQNYDVRQTVADFRELISKLKNHG